MLSQVGPQAVQAAQVAQAAAAVKTEVTFNNTAPRTRNILTKRSTQAELETKWRVLVSVKGKYYPPGQRATSKEDDERPLFLRITPGRSLPNVRNRVCFSVP